MHRQYSCFICGSLYDTHEEFTAHILEDHEEGREYILCPFQHCKAPVRDLRIHFKNKHPHNKLPEGCQLKAAVWYDIRSPNLRKKKIAFEEGFYMSHKNGNQNMHYRSGYERRVYESLERLGEVLGWKVEPVQIPYHFRGRERHYIPDLFVYFADGRKELWEIKPANQTGMAQNRSKWESARRWCLMRGLVFKVITEKDMGVLFQESRKII